MKITTCNGRTQDATAHCERDHAAAILALATAEAALDAAAQAYAVALGRGRDAALAARRAQGEAEVDCDLARHAVEQAAERLGSARAAATAAEAERLKTEALDRIGELKAAATRELKAMAAGGRRLARLRAEAELARQAAVHAGVPDIDLPEVEGFRDVPALPEKVIETTRVTRWIHPYTHNPLDDDQSRRVTVQGGEAYLATGGAPMQLTHQREFDRVVYLPSRRAVRADSLLGTLRVPGLMADDIPGWTEPQGEAPHLVLEHLDALEHAPPSDRTDRRKSEVTLRPV